MLFYPLFSVFFVFFLAKSPCLAKLESKLSLSKTEREAPQRKLLATVLAGRGPCESVRLLCRTTRRRGFCIYPPKESWHNESTAPLMYGDGATRKADNPVNCPQPKRTRRMPSALPKSERPKDGGTRLRGNRFGENLTKERGYFI